MTELLNSFAALIESGASYALPLAFLAGVLTSFTPCSLTSIPLVLGVVGASSRKTTSSSFTLSVVFSTGFALVTAALGLMASSLGGLLSQGLNAWFYLTLGVVCIVMSLQLGGIVDVLPSSGLVSKTRPRGYVGALIAGALSGLFSSPCATPVLIVLLGMASASKNAGYGALLLLAYALGHSILAIVTGTFVGFASSLAHSKNYQKVARLLQLIMAAGAFVLGIYMLYLGL